MKLYAVLAAFFAQIGTLIAAFVGGRRSANKDAKIDDFEHAADIDSNVRDNLDDRVRKLDDAGWRD